MADSFIAMLDASAATQNLDTRTEATNTNHRQVVVVGDPSVNANVGTVDATGAQKTRESRGATSTFQQWTIATSAATSVVAADATRLGVTLVATATATGRVYIRFDATGPTAVNYDWYLDPDERYEVPLVMAGLAISFLGTSAAGFVNISLTTP